MHACILTLSISEDGSTDLEIDDVVTDASLTIDTPCRLLPRKDIHALQCFSEFFRWKSHIGPPNYHTILKLTLELSKHLV
jgi:hypothetical protein